MSWTTIDRHVGLEEIQTVLVQALGASFRVSQEPGDANEVLILRGTPRVKITVRAGWVGEATTLKVTGSGLTSHRVRETLRHSL